MFNRLQPVLFVDSIQNEVEFYQKFGFRIEHEEQSFVSLAYGNTILFGLQHKPGSIFHDSQPLIWQIGTDDIDAVYQRCQQAQLTIYQNLEIQSWGEWMFGVISPNGYRVIFEGRKI
jgi:uncharacterized glyoxalase superfamily protein PhnB